MYMRLLNNISFNKKLDIKNKKTATLYKSITVLFLVAGTGLEPVTFGL